MSITSLIVLPQSLTNTSGQWVSSTSRSVFIARKTPAMSSETGATACHFARFLTSHFPAVDRNCNCQPSDRRGETCEQRKSEISPASVLTVDGMYNSEWDAGAGN